MKESINMNPLKSISCLFLGVLFLSSCNHDFSHIPEHSKPGWEYAPNMYHSEAYEPVTVIDDSLKYPESYNQMPGNEKFGNLKTPVKGTIKRGFMPYHVPKDSLAKGALVKSPFTVNEELLAEGEVLFSKFCAHCHGDAGAGDGPVNEKLKGVANLTAGQMLTVSEGHIFHVITYGKGRMGSHASQLDQSERWKIAHFVKEKLQKAN